MKPVVFLGNSLDRIRAFPIEARRQAGFQLDRLQSGLDPNDWKPMKTIGKSVREIRIREGGGAYPVIYLANVGDAVYVLHAFVKTSQGTAQSDIELAATRFRELMRGVQK